MRSEYLIAACALGLILGGTQATGQGLQSGQPGGPFFQRRAAARAPLDQTRMFIADEMGLGAKLVKGAPFSAQVLTDFTQTLADGTQIHRTSTGAVYRDSEGRTRREQTLPAVGPLGSAGTPSQMVFISDPAAGFAYILNVSKKTAQKIALPASSGQAGVARRRMGGGAAGAANTFKNEPLGTQVIGGLQAEGTRTTVTIPAGQIGNDRPLAVVSERWYSQQLQTVMLLKHSDPRVGNNVYQLTNINQAEPDQSLFQVPPDYTVSQGPNRPFRTQMAPRRK